MDVEDTDRRWTDVFLEGDIEEPERQRNVSEPPVNGIIKDI